jgi:hypothetical protein
VVEVGEAAVPPAVALLAMVVEAPPVVAAVHPAVADLPAALPAAVRPVVALPAAAAVVPLRLSASLIYEAGSLQSLVR